MKRLLCLLFGHPDSRVVWGPWEVDREWGMYRVVAEECARCGGVLAVSALAWGDGEEWAL